jgi:hypothetical protein
LNGFADDIDYGSVMSRGAGFQPAVISADVVSFGGLLQLSDG